MNDLSNSVIMPREDFIELSTVAFDNHHVPSASERAGLILQNTALFAGIGAAIVATAYGWSWAKDRFDRRRHERDLTELQFKVDNGITVK